MLRALSLDAIRASEWNLVANFALLSDFKPLFRQLAYEMSSMKALVYYTMDYETTPVLYYRLIHACVARGAVSVSFSRGSSDVIRHRICPIDLLDMVLFTIS